MKVYYETMLYGDKANEHQGYKPTDRWGFQKEGIESCCSEMTHAIDEGYITFEGNYDTVPTPALNILEPEYEGYSRHPIKFCPFCGEAITYVHTKVKRFVRTEKVETRTISDYEIKVIKESEKP